MRVLEREAELDVGRQAAPSSPATRSANIRRWRRRGRSASPTRRGCCASAARRCSRRCRWARARWRRCSASTSTRRAEIARGGGAAARSATSPTTTRRARSCLSGAQGRGRARRRDRQGRARKRAILLPVSAPFHCALMQPAADEMAEALAAATIAPPRVPLVANVTARPVSDPETIRSAAGRAGHRHGALARERAAI